MLDISYIPDHILEGNDFTARCATTQEDVLAVQKLRYDVFYREKGAHPSPEMLEKGLDFDRLDPYAVHIMMEKDGEIVGTARLILSQNLPDGEKFYTEDFFDCGKIIEKYDNLMEIGRACVSDEYRRGPALSMIWKYAMTVIDKTKTDLCFGCASFSGNDPQEHKHTLSHLHTFNLSPEELRPKAIVDDIVSMRQMPDDEIELRKAVRGIPTLLHGYLKLGGYICDDAVIDRQFNTIFTCIFVDITKIPEETYLNMLSK